LRNKKRQLKEEEFSFIEMEAKLAKKRQEVFDVETQSQSLNVCIDLINAKKSRDLVEKLTKGFKDFEKDLGMQKFLAKRGCQKVDDFEKEHDHVSSRLKDVTI
jgi:hypothetical protein